MSGTPLAVSAVCGGDLALYADGSYIGNTSSPTVFSTSVPGDTSVLAVSCEVGQGNTGILLSTSSGVASDNSWLCSDTVTGHDWTEEVFDDTAWQQADQQGQNNLGEHRQIGPYAHWVWLGSSSPLFCRKTISSSQDKSVTQFVASVDDCAMRCLLGSVCDMFHIRYTLL